MAHYPFFTGAIAEDYNQNNDSLLSDIEMSIEDQQDASQTDEQSNTSQHDLGNDTIQCRIIMKISKI